MGPGIQMGENVIVRLWKWFWSPSKKFAWGGILVIGVIAGVLGFGGFNAFVAHTSTLEFCVSCHEEDAFAEYRETVHYSNASGVRAECGDCHIPRQWTYKMIRKVEATRDLLAYFMGTIDTPEKFEERRLEMAKRVWARMRWNGQVGCKNCHDYETMDPAEQERRARKKHPKAVEKGQVCIDCHKGIAHELPEDYEEEEEGESG